MNLIAIRKLESEARPQRLVWRSWTALIAVIGLFTGQGCSYPEVSPRTYEISKALYSVCNLKRKAELDKVEDAISAAVTASELSENESKWLMAIVERARSGEWEEAAEEARAILQDQVNR